MNPLNSQTLINLYDKYHADLADVKKQQKQQYKRYNIKSYNKNRLLNRLIHFHRSFRVNAVTNSGAIEKTYPPSFDDLEAEITYLLVREAKPQNMIEFSPASGWSTSWILSALRDNDKGILTSFDLEDYATKLIPAELAGDRWVFRLGDVKENIRAVSGIDYLFVDSDHSAPFADWYLGEVMPKVRAGAPVSIHDIYLRKQETYGEIGRVLDWLGKQRIEYITASRYAKDSIRVSVFDKRRELDLDSQIHFSGVNSAVFFVKTA